MKKVVTAASVATVMLSTTAFALTFSGTNIPKAGVVASKHNMNLYAENTPDQEGRVCAFCHTPHHAITDPTNTADYLPLWSHNLSTQSSYTPYWSPTLNVSIPNPLSGPTALCMSCHDGVIAIDQHYGNSANTTKLTDDTFGGTAVGLGGNLSNDHPVGFQYSDAFNNHPGELKDPGNTYLGGTKTIAQQLVNGVFSCASCHDVHNKDNVVITLPGSTDKNYFLLSDKNGSQLCLSCHIK